MSKHPFARTSGLEQGKLSRKFLKAVASYHNLDISNGQLLFERKLATYEYLCILNILSASEQLGKLTFHLDTELLPGKFEDTFPGFFAQLFTKLSIVVEFF